MTRITKYPLPKFRKRLFGLRDREVGHLAFRLWGDPALGSIIYFDNLVELDYDAENVKSGAKLKQRDLSGIGGSYTVQPAAGAQPATALSGVTAETIYEVAEKTLGSRYLYMKIARKNKLEPPYLLRAGQALKIPSLLRGGKLRLAQTAASARGGWK